MCTRVLQQICATGWPKENLCSKYGPDHPGVMKRQHLEPTVAELCIRRHGGEKNERAPEASDSRCRSVSSLAMPGEAASYQCNAQGPSASSCRFPHGCTGFNDGELFCTNVPPSKREPALPCTLSSCSCALEHPHERHHWLGRGPASAFICLNLCLADNTGRK